MKVKTKGRIVFAMAFLIALLIYKVGSCEVYEVPNFIGGINAVFDSTNLAPNEALIMSNFTLDVPNVLSARQGFSYWDSTAFGSAEIEEIFVYEPYVDSFRMVVATGGYFYVSDSLGINGDIDWDTMRISITGDSLAVANGDSAIHNAVSQDWWYAWVSGLDSIDIDGVEYGILNMSDTTDTLLYLTSDYTGSTDTLADYTIYKTYTGTPFINQYRGKLYMGSSERFAIIYNDTIYQHFSLIDSGTVTDTATANDTITAYNRGQATMSAGLLSYAIGDENVFWRDSVNIVPLSDVFEYHFYTSGSPDQEQIWTAEIIDTAYEDNSERLKLSDGFPYRGSLLDQFNNYEIKRADYNCSGDNGFFISDNNKHWRDVELGDTQFLNNTYAITGDNGYIGLHTIYCNTDSAFAVDGGGVFEPDDRYYIFMSVPNDLEGVDSVWKESKRYEDMLFDGNVMYGFGFDRSGFKTPYDPWPNPFDPHFDNVSETNRHRIWYGHTFYPTYSQFDYNFDVNYNEDITARFKLRGDSYFGTENGIWRSSGIPAMTTSSGNQIFTNVISSNGIPDRKYWTKATEEYGYFTNITGIYRFNGVRAEKMSLRVDPIIKKNYASRIVMGYQDFRLYVSFPDSNFTLVYDERYDAFYTYDFGMTAFYAMPDTNIFYFGHSELPGRVYYFPNGKYYNQLAGATGTYTTTYESGWQDYGEYWHGKRLERGYFPISTVALAGGGPSSIVKIYKDFEATVSDSIQADSSGRYVYRHEFDNDCWGEYFKVAITSAVDSSLIIKGYKLEWSKPGDPIK